jgi:hypothetical protein
MKILYCRWMAFKHGIPIAPSPERRSGWFSLQEGDTCPEALGFREAPGGGHLSKTMILAELIAVMEALPARDAVTKGSARAAGSP